MSESSASSLHIVGSVLLGISVICVSLRFYARRRQKAPLLADDWILVPAVVRPLYIPKMRQCITMPLSRKTAKLNTFTDHLCWRLRMPVLRYVGSDYSRLSETGLLTCGFVQGESIKAFGYSSYEVSKEEKVATLPANAKVGNRKYGPLSWSSSGKKNAGALFTDAQMSQVQLALNLIGIGSLAFVKMSALLFYKRIFCVSGRKAVFSIVIVTSVVVVALWFVAMEFFVGFQCGTHYEAQWQGHAAQYCKLVWPSNQGLAISDLILDVWVLVLPIYPVCISSNSPPAPTVLSWLAV